MAKTSYPRHRLTADDWTAFDKLMMNDTPGLTGKNLKSLAEGLGGLRGTICVPDYGQTDTWLDERSMVDMALAVYIALDLARGNENLSLVVLGHSMRKEELQAILVGVLANVDPFTILSTVTKPTTAEYERTKEARRELEAMDDRLDLIGSKELGAKTSEEIAAQVEAYDTADREGVVCLWLGLEGIEVGYIEPATGTSAGSTQSARIMENERRARRSRFVERTCLRMPDVVNIISGKGVDIPNASTITLPMNNSTMEYDRLRLQPPMQKDGHLDVSKSGYHVIELEAVVAQTTHRIRPGQEVPASTPVDLPPDQEDGLNVTIRQAPVQ